MVESLTDSVKRELLAVEGQRPSARLAEAAALLRLSAQFQVGTGDRLVIEAELDDAGVAKRLHGLIEELFHITPATRVVSPGGANKAPRYVIRITDGARDVARRTGLIRPGGTLVRGLPPWIVSGAVEEAEAAWRGAFLVSGSVTEPGKASSLEVVCPCQEAALALVGVGRRLNLVVKTKESRGQQRVMVRDGDQVGALLTRLGAHRSRLEWDAKRLRREVHTSANRLANFDDANLRRSARAAVAAAARVERAMVILGDGVPEHLAEAGLLRVQHRQASLEELGRLADPPMTKDAIAGRIRRLLSMADKKAHDEDIPDTNAAVTDDLLGED